MWKSSYTELCLSPQRAGGLKDSRFFFAKSCFVWKYSSGRCHYSAVNLRRNSCGGGTVTGHILFQCVITKSGNFSKHLPVERAEQERKSERKNELRTKVKEEEKIKKSRNKVRVNEESHGKVLRPFSTKPTEIKSETLSGDIYPC